MALAQASDWLKSNFSKKAFWAVLWFFAILYGGLAVWIATNGSKAQEVLQDRLASITALIDHKDGALGAPQGDLPAGTSQDEVQKVKPRPALGSYSDLNMLPNGMVAAPVPGLLEKSDGGLMLPVKRKDGLTAFDAYRRPFDRHLVDTPIISIAIMNMGLSGAATESAIKDMPAEISLIMSPYASALEFWVGEARAHGHEVWLTMPMETESYPAYDPGPHTLLINATEQENQKKIEWVMGQTTGYVGFVTEYQPSFIKAVNDMRPILSKVYTRGLAFVDGSENPIIAPQSMALGANAPYATIDIWIDIDPSQDNINEALKKLETIADERGLAAGVIHAYPVSYQEIRKWTESLQTRGYTLAPLSAQTGM